MKRTIFILISSCWVMAACQSTATQQQEATTLFFNGTIYTADDENSLVESVVVRDDRIVFTGPIAEASAYLAPDAQRVDLNGGSMLPGLIDAHVHPVRGAIADLYHCKFKFDSTPEEIQATLRTCIAEQPDADWIEGGQWDSAFFQRFNLESPRAVLDAVSRDKAILLRDDSLHNIWVNSRALEIAGVNADTPDPEGGTIVRDANGQPNGVLLETAAKMVGAFKPAYTEAEIEAAVRNFVTAVNAYGLTGVKTASTHEWELNGLNSVDRAEGLSLHVATSIRTTEGKRKEPLDYTQLLALRDQYASTNVDTRFVKLFMDGVPTPARTAAMIHAYVPDALHGDHFTGEILIDPDALKKDIAELDRLGFTVKIHTAGDRSVREALNAIEYARDTNKNKNLRHELAHAGYIDEADIPRFHELNTVADLSPILWYPSPIIDAIYRAVGEDRGHRYFPVRDLIDADAPLLAGSDWPAVSVNANPWPGIESLVTRAHPFGKAEGTLWPEQAITLIEALRIYTIDGARALRKERETGSLEVGKLADFVVLSEDIFDVPTSEVSDIEPRQTWFAGKIVYQQAVQ